MRSLKPVYFSLIVAVMGVSAYYSAPAISRDNSLRLKHATAGSLPLSFDCDLFIARAGSPSVLADNSSSVLELEEGTVDETPRQNEQAPADADLAAPMESDETPAPQQAQEPPQQEEPTRIAEPAVAEPAGDSALEEKRKASANGRKKFPAPAQNTPVEETLLSELVRELEFGTLKNSILLLNQLTTKYPEDPDYRSLLAMALRLRDGDVWYAYQRKVDNKEERETKVPPQNIIKPVANDTVNELKKSSWFLIRSARR